MAMTHVAISVAAEMTEREHRQISWWLIWTQLLRRLGPGILVLLLFVTCYAYSLYFLFTDRMIGAGPRALGILVAMATVLGIQLGWSYLVSNAYAHYRSSMPIRFELTEHGITMISRNAVVARGWHDLDAIRRTSSFVVFRKGYGAWVIPRRCLTDEQDHALASMIKRARRSRT